MGDRRPHLDKRLVDVVTLIDRHGRARKAGQVARELGGVGTEGHGVHAVLAAGVHGQAVVAIGDLRPYLPRSPVMSMCSTCSVLLPEAVPGVSR